jgi:anti-anti-sigma factor
MSIQDWSEDVILVELPAEPEIAAQLREAIQLVHHRGACDVVIDFSQVDIITSASLAQLMRLHKTLAECEQKLTLCHIGAATMGIFSVTGLDDIFTMVQDKSDALATPQAIH